MKHSNIFSVLILIICFFIVGCNTAEPPEPTAAQISVLPGITPQPAATFTAVPTITPSPTDTPVQTPTFYSDIWFSGQLSPPILHAGANSGIPFLPFRLPYEPLNETVAEALAAIPTDALVVLYGDYTPDEAEGRLLVKQVEQVHLPYSEDTPMSAVYTDPHNRFSFAYPEGWTVQVEEGGNALRLINRPPDSLHFEGTHTGSPDPTEVRVSIHVKDMSAEAFIQSRREMEQLGEDVPEEVYRKVTVNEVVFNSLPFTEIVEESILLPPNIYYVTSLDNNTSLYLYHIQEARFAQRLLETLSL